MWGALRKKRKRKTSVLVQQGSKNERMKISASSELGYVFLSSLFTSDEVSELANYRVQTEAAALGASGRVSYQLTPQWSIAGELGYRATRSDPGIRYEDTSGRRGDIPFTIHEFKPELKLRHHLRQTRGITVFALLGYYFFHSAMDEMDNLAKLPSELLHGIRMGSGIEVKQFWQGLGFSLARGCWLGDVG